MYVFNKKIWSEDLVIDKQSARECWALPQEKKRLLDDDTLEIMQIQEEELIERYNEDHSNSFEENNGDTYEME